VPREPLITVWLGRRQDAELKRALDEFASRLAGLEAPTVERRSAAPVRPSCTSSAMVKPLGYLGQGAVYLLLGLGIGYFSDRPAHTHSPPDMALIKLSFAHGAQKEDCRRRTAEELAKLPPNMRRPMVCSRERLQARWNSCSTASRCTRRCCRRPALHGTARPGSISASLCRPGGRS
jgi:hypothetical protein